MTIQENVPLAPLTTLKVGGPARFFVRAESERDVCAAVEFAEKRGLGLFVLGGGSNVVIADEGFGGLVLQLALRGVSVFDEGERVALTARAGEDWDGLVRFCVERDLAGIECLSGIPGLVGAVPVQNVGAYGQEVSETIVSVRCFDRRARALCELSRDECGFGYRSSIFNESERDRFIILSVTFALARGGAPRCVYKDLRDYFGAGQPSLKEVREAVLRIRRAKSMVIDPADPDSRSVGSFFKNPIVTASEFAALSERWAQDDSLPIPHFKLADGRVKLMAAWLIERAGFPRGYRKGGVGISTKHSLAIVNCGRATAREIIALKQEIQQRVAEKFHIWLVPEPVFVGFNEPIA
ncbi:MAG: UDP-N-acetylenolpyruvoylglucosamine reductase [Pyrinomonas sp.]|uniref:UDP-N-acetylmuramate dehydrogenase n=1 Tax=Pyrinomonas sp. TaxID=2080306 RepID=UPI0033266F28